MEKGHCCCREQHGAGMAKKPKGGCVCGGGEMGKERELSSKNRLSFHANGKCQEKIQLNRRVALSGSR